MCNSLWPVTPSRKDVLTDGTKKSIAGTNAVIETWCGERPIPKDEQKVASGEKPKG